MNKILEDVGGLFDFSRNTKAPKMASLSTRKKGATICRSHVISDRQALEQDVHNVILKVKK
ncbi:MAG: hypothetical protein EP298_08765 [Gammaproteobacteria bacterium]|nr:MAG: hypothetical protein EP298_08765 [Gammaproteobacteria bacterium]UTW43128.1 hypothetical protein KFE69_03000 [bacterium SCSIO 12844]